MTIIKKKYIKCTDLNYHPDLFKVMKNGPTNCPFCNHRLDINLFDNTFFADVSCNSCSYNPEIYNDQDNDTYNYMDFYIHLSDKLVITVQCATRFTKIDYNPISRVLVIPPSQLNITNLSSLTSKLKTYMIFS